MQREFWSDPVWRLDGCPSLPARPPSLLTILPTCLPARQYPSACFSYAGHSLLELRRLCAYASGFVLGAALATKLGKGFLAVRKGGSLSCDIDEVPIFERTRFYASPFCSSLIELFVPL